MLIDTLACSPLQLFAAKDYYYYGYTHIHVIIHSYVMSLQMSEVWVVVKTGMSKRKCGKVELEYRSAR